MADVATDSLKVFARPSLPYNGATSTSENFLSITMSGWHVSAHTADSLTSACSCGSKPWSCRIYPQRLVRCSSWNEATRRNVLLGTGASLAGLSVGTHSTGPASAMSGPHSVERSDLDGLNISQVRGNVSHIAQ